MSTIIRGLRRLFQRVIRAVRPPPPLPPKRELHLWMLRPENRRPMTLREITQRFPEVGANQLLEQLIQQREAVRTPDGRYMAIAYRTEIVTSFFTRHPGTKTPDPIAEFRYTAVSPEKGKWKHLIENYQSLASHLGMILAPQTFWKQVIQENRTPRGTEIYHRFGYEEDEEILADEINTSIPYSKELNYAERYAIFYNRKTRLREKLPEYWEHPLDEWLEILEPQQTRPPDRAISPHGHYEYGEEYIKNAEEEKIRTGRLKTRFNNRTGRLESA